MNLASYTALCVVLAALNGGAQSARSQTPWSSSESQCVEFKDTLVTSATNIAGITLNSTGSGTARIRPTAFQMFFRFCEPHHSTRRARTVQILGHGATYNHRYWNIDYRPEIYSYERAALAEGYSVMSYDLLGSGNSAKPDPFNIVQNPLNIEIAVKVIRAVRHGALSFSHTQLPRFDNVVYVGHAMGSMILNGVLAASPGLVDAAVLTGYAHVKLPTPTVASEALPERFGRLSNGYTVIPHREVFYGPAGSYEDELLQLDMATQDVVSVGEAVTLSSGAISAPEFTGHVLAVNGEQDVVYCVESGCPNLFREIAFYPAAASFEAHVVSNTGHVLNLHETSRSTYAMILDWLDRKGF
ncbi:Alpha/Beta hydrolase protein [Auriculariales sp. MPI-PUGE-AT-0066]|nr:Alpha/Beta hydrolase protein [Auriculariales sp. MPI-PUGE-AT-0066]